LTGAAQWHRAEQIDPVIYARLTKNNQHMFDAITANIFSDLDEELHGSVLDLASGPGEPSVSIALRAAEEQTKNRIFRIVSTDSQPAMNEKAKERAEKAGVSLDLNTAPHMEFAVSSADDLSQFEDASFHAVTMCYGLMFVPNRAKCLEEIYRVLKPGGLAYLAVWKKLTFHEFAHEVLAEINDGSRMPEFSINPLALKEEGSVEKFVEAAKLDILRDELIESDFRLGTARDTAESLTMLAGSSLKTLEAEGKADVNNKFYEIVEREVEKRGWKTEDGVVIPDNKPQLLTLIKTVKEEL